MSDDNKTPPPPPPSQVVIQPVMFDGKDTPSTPFQMIMEHATPCTINCTEPSGHYIEIPFSLPIDHDEDNK